MAYRIETHDLDGTGPKPVRVYDVPPATLEVRGGGTIPDYWSAVTDVPCPCCAGGTVRWAEAGYVPGYRICDGCGRHFLAGGTGAAPTLIRVGTRRSEVERA